MTSPILMATINETPRPKIAEPVTWENEGATVPNITEIKPTSMDTEKVEPVGQGVRRRREMQRQPRLGRRCLRLLPRRGARWIPPT